MAGYKGLRWNLGGPFQAGDSRNATARVESQTKRDAGLGSQISS